VTDKESRPWKNNVAALSFFSLCLFSPAVGDTGGRLDVVALPAGAVVSGQQECRRGETEGGGLVIVSAAGRLFPRQNQSR